LKVSSRKKWPSDTKNKKAIAKRRCFNLKCSYHYFWGMLMMMAMIVTLVLLISGNKDDDGNEYDIFSFLL